MVAATFTGVGTLGARHFGHLKDPSNFAIANIFSFLYLGSMMFLAYAKRTHRVPRDQRQVLDVLTVDVVIPAYNEDRVTLLASLDSLDNQTRLPRRVYVVDDGSTVPVANYIADWQAHQGRHRALNFELVVFRQPNAGKREAQARAFEASDADILVTSDSDTVYDDRAIAEGLKPFLDPRTQSVAGMLLGLNNRRSVFTRVVDLGFTMSFLVGRMAEGVVGGVTVNCGGLAFYRGAVIRENLTTYLNQRFLGRPVSSGDDRMLTNFAMLRGRTVFQETSVAYTLLPANLSHLVRQRVRWARSWYWGVGWLLTRLRFRHPSFWLTYGNVTSFALYTGLVLVIVCRRAIIAPQSLWGFALVLVIIGYIRSLRYLLIRRPDESFRSQLFTWALSPLTSLLQALVLSPLYYWAGLTMRNARWGTRQDVEVGL